MDATRARLIEDLADLVRRACAAIQNVAERGYEVHEKADFSPLTCADLAAQAVLGPGLADIAPMYAVLSEEAMPASLQDALAAPGYFAVDPLDGTKEFIARTGDYSVNVALIEHGRPTLGIIGRPLTGQLWIGVPGEGCERREADGSRTALRTQPAGCPLKVALSRFHPSSELLGRLGGCGDYEAVTIGAALKFVALIEGRLDLYPRLKSGMAQWDICAGHALVEAAGGAMTRLDGQPLHYTPAALTSPGFIAYGDRGVDWVEMLGVPASGPA